MMQFLSYTMFRLLIFLLVILGSCKEAKKQYHDNANLKSVAHYNNKGNLDGLKKKYDKKGNILLKETYENGKKEGIQKYYYPNGKLRKKAEYHKGVLDGIYNKFYKNGKVKMDGAFKNGKQHCLCKWFYKNGEIETIAKYSKGERQGMAKIYYQNGQLRLYSIKRNDSTIVYNEEYDSNGTFLNELRKIQVHQKKDTISVEDKLTFKVKPYGPTYHYDSFYIKIVRKNVYNFKDSFNTHEVPKMRLKKRSKDLKIYGDTAPSFKTRYHIRAYSQKVSRDNWLGLLPVKAEWIQEKKQDKDSVFHLTFQPKDTGNHLLIGNYGLIPTDTAPVKSIQDYPFSVRFYVRPEN